MKRTRNVDLMDRFFAGLTDEKENSELKNMLKEDFDSAFNEMCSSDQLVTLSEEQRDRMCQEMLDKVDNYEKEQADVRKKRQARILHFVYGTVAAAAVVAFSLFAGYRYSEHQKAGQQYELLCANGQQSLLTLPDGTQVHLNSSSKLTYSSSYNSKDRVVALEGEAYFDVAHDEDKPFVVNAGEMSVQVLGTKFNVKAYEGDDEIEATLVEGKIQADVAGEEEILLPHERLCYNKASGKLQKTQVEEQVTLVPWLEDEIYFKHNTLKEIAVVLQRMYDIEVVFEDKEIETYSYTGYVRNTSLKNILELIASTSSIEYRADGTKT